LTTAVVSLLTNLLNENNIEYLSIAGRPKGMNSALEKIERKKYSNPREQLTDLSGIRVITYLESQVTQITESVRKVFEVDESNSLDRTSMLGADRIGYRSAHFVCTLGKVRGSLPEYEALADLKFEIQVRTVLQHAWAELAHDRSFKFAPGLPSPIQRKLNLYSGMLEVVDSAFDAIAKEIDEYSVSIERSTVDELSNVEISSISLEKYISSIERKFDLHLPRVGVDNDLLGELAHFGLSTIGDLEGISSDEYIKLSKQLDVDNTEIGFLRGIMIYKDIDKYFSGPIRWTAIDPRDVELLSKKYGAEKVANILREHSIDVTEGA
jgi:ppGpp synthetase/RelA/SpoT-type nucleotidyltranferase